MKRNLQGTWDEEEIKSRIAEIEESLKTCDSKPKKKRLFSRLGELKAALRGETTVGGQLETLNPEKPKAKRPRTETKRDDAPTPASANVLCLCCREFGHRMSDCPTNKETKTVSTAAEAAADEIDSDEKKEEKTVHPFRVPRSTPTLMCYNCGSNEHSLKNCSLPRAANGNLPHAVCFICKEKGHLASVCEQNLNGIYPNGGGCRTCGSVMHLQKDCKIYLAKLEEEKERDAIKQAKKEEYDEDFGGNVEYSVEHKSRANWGFSDSKGARHFDRASSRGRGGFRGGDRDGGFRRDGGGFRRDGGGGGFRGGRGGGFGGGYRGRD